MENIHPQVQGFILYCIQHRGKEWPGLYDEMCRVAGRGLYQQLGYTELGKLGLSFGLNRMDETFQMVQAVTVSEVDAKSSILPTEAS